LRNSRQEILRKNRKLDVFTPERKFYKQAYIFLSIIGGGIISREIVLTGFGETTGKFAKKVAYYLNKDFGFKVTQADDRGDMRGIYLDNENKFCRPVEELDAGIFKDKIVYIVQDTRIYDNRLIWESQKLEELVAKHDDPELVKVANQIKYLSQPNLSTKQGPKFGSVENLPARQLEKLKFTINYFHKHAQAKYVVYATRKTSEEWSHNWKKAMISRKRFEAPAWDILLTELNALGLNGVVILHPHAPIEGLEICQRLGMNYVNINPQTHSTRNGELIDLNAFFSENHLDQALLFPQKNYILSRRENQGQYLPDRTIIIAPDIGAAPATKEFAESLGLMYILSLKERVDEGRSKVLQTGNIDEFLTELAKKDPNATVTFVIVDDKANTMHTGGEEVRWRKNQLAQFNQQNQTNFSGKYELFCTHLRTPYVEMMEHEEFTKIVVLDTVEYKPAIDVWLKKKGIYDKFRILTDTAAYNVSAGIALDFEKQFMGR
jgi:hypothetical protein